MGCLSVYFVGMRQILGVAILVAALYYSMNLGKPVKYKLLLSGGAIVLSYLFHTSCAIYGLIYVVSFFIPIKSRILYIGLVIVSLMIGYVFESFDIQSIFSLYLSLNVGITERIENYFMSDDFNDSGYFNIIMRQSIIALVAFLFMDKDKLNHPFCKIYIIGVVIYNMFYTVPMIHRIIPPLIMFGAVCYSWIFGGYKYASVLKYKKMINLVCVLVLLYFTRSEMINNSDCDLSSEERMHPYYFFFQDYMDHPSVTKF